MIAFIPAEVNFKANAPPFAVSFRQTGAFPERFIGNVKNDEVGRRGGGTGHLAARGARAEGEAAGGAG
jgi:hypothetical protein